MSSPEPRRPGQHPDGSEPAAARPVTVVTAETDALIASAETAAHEHSTASRLFDLRLITAMLFVFYGVLLTVTGLVHTTPQELAQTGGLRINLWAGAGILLVGALFALWARLKPLDSGLAN